jgi:hypothetical protein
MLSENYKWNIINTFFKKKGFVSHQIDTFNDFLNNGIQCVVNEVDINLDQPDQDYKYSISFGQVHIPNPTIIEEDRSIRPMLPAEARQRDLTYDSPIFVDITEVFQIKDQEPEIYEHKRIIIGRTPIMLLSDKCNLTNFSKHERIVNGECDNDHGGYFIIKGKERVIVGQLRGIYNQPIVLSQKAGEKFKYICEVRSMSEETGHSVLIQAKIGIDDRTLVFSIPYIRECIPIGIIFKALGYLNEYEIANIIGNKYNDKNIERYIKYIIRDSYFIKTQEEALTYISEYTIHIIKDENKIKYVSQVVENELLPHMGIFATIKEKCFFLGHMVNKLLRTSIGTRKEDDRDNYANKRVEMTGVLFCELFRTLFKRFVKTIEMQIEKKKQRPDILNIISRTNSITSGLKTCISTGSWSVSKTNYVRTGVSQVLSRLTYGATLSHMRRIVIPIGKEGKNAKIRQIHSSQIFYICPTECFDPDTPILTWDGQVKLAKDIVVGDVLIDDKGNPTKVRKTISGVAPMYEVKTDKNNFLNYTVTSNHILTLKVRGHRKLRYVQKKNRSPYYEVTYFDKKNLSFYSKSFNNKENAELFSNGLEDNIIDITISQYLKLPKNIQEKCVIFKCNGINWEKQDVLLDPYILGMWLGDGLKSGYGFVSADEELIDYWVKWGEDNDATVKHHKKYQYGLSSTINNSQVETENLKDKRGRDILKNRPERAPLKKLLEHYNLIDNKHIPKEYLLNDRETRLKVLAGLIDTDGSVRANGHEIRISQGPRNYQIVYDALYLAQSLGFSCHLNSGKNQWTDEKTGKKKFGEYKELSITGQYLYEIPILLPHKKLEKFTNIITIAKCPSYLQTRFKLIEKPIGDFVGFQLEGDGRFLLSDFSTSHNTPEGMVFKVNLWFKFIF